MASLSRHNLSPESLRWQELLLHDAQLPADPWTKIIGEPPSSEIQKVIHYKVSPFADWRKSLKAAKDRASQILSGHVEYSDENWDLLKDALNKLVAGDGAKSNDLFLEAEKKSEKNLLVKYFLGMIQLYCAEAVNVESALAYFTKVCQPSEMAAVTNALSRHESESFSPWKYDVVAESYFHSGVALYLQGKFPECSKIADKAREMSDKLPEAAFLKCKALSAMDRDTEALTILADLIVQNPFYAVKTANDSELNKKKPIQNLLSHLRDDVAARLAGRIAECRRIMIPNSIAAHYWDQIEKALESKTYFDVLYGEAELSRPRDWSLKKPIVNFLPLQRIFRHWEEINSLSFNSGAQLLAMGSSDSAVTVWDIAKNKEFRRLKGHSYGVDCVAFSHLGALASGAGDTTIKLWNTQTGRCMATLQGHHHKVDSISFSPDGTQLVSSAGDHAIQLWNVEDGSNRRSLVDHTDAVNSVRFNHDGTLLMSGSSDHTVKVWDLKTGTVQRTFTGHKDVVRVVRFSPDGKYVASAGMDRTILIWEVSSGEIAIRISGHSETIHSLSFSRDGMLLASAGSDKTIKLWDVFSGKELTELSGHRYAVRTVTFHHDGTLLASGDEGGEVILWSRQSYVVGDPMITMSLSLSLEMFLQYERRNDEEMRAGEKEKEHQKVEEEKYHARERRFRAVAILYEGKLEEHEQDKRWFFKNYSEALRLYQSAHELGHEDAEDLLQMLQKKIEMLEARKKEPFWTRIMKKGN